MRKRILITGGAGFIGINASSYYLQKGWDVVLFDNFSRKGVEHNIEYIKSLKQGKLRIIKGDIRFHRRKLVSIIKDVDFILHLAAQVAVTTSVEDPREDFDINARGTLNILEAIRSSGHKPVFLYSSTNKVYGGLEHIPVEEKTTRYVFKRLPYGVSEKENLDFHSPYGCSKGAADQYVRDYWRIYGLKTIVFRQSCIYGPHQFGREDQGWVAWFMIALTKRKKITIYGNGKQVRDILYIDDLLNAYDLAFHNIHKTQGQTYNIGGGFKNTISVWYEFAPLLTRLFGRKITPTFLDWRPGDQPIFIADIRKARSDFGWKPKIGVREGIEKLYRWISENKELF